MAKPLDYYAGYPNQQKMPKWVGVTLGSLFGGVALIALCIGVRIAMPAHRAEASALPAKPAPVAAPVVAPPEAVATEVADAAPVATKASKHHHGSKKAGRVSLASAKSSSKKNKKAQLYAKHVSSTSHRDKRARDDLDKMLGL